MIKYDKFFRLLQERNISTYEFRKRNILGSCTIRLLRKNKCGLSSEDLDRICELLNCQPGDLMEYAGNDKR